MLAMITMKNTEIKRIMTKTYALVLTESELDLIFDALMEMKNSSEEAEAEQACVIMDKMYDLQIPVSLN